MHGISNLNESGRLDTDQAILGQTPFAPPLIGIRPLEKNELHHIPVNHSALEHVAPNALALAAAGGPLCGPS